MTTVGIIALVVALLANAAAIVGVGILNWMMRGQNEQIIKATNGLLAQLIAVERKDARAEGNLAGHAEEQGEAKDRGDVRGSNAAGQLKKATP